MSYIDINDPRSKTYAYDYDDYDNGKGPVSMVEEILADPDFPGLEYLVIGSWGSAYEDGCQEIIDGIVDHADRFSHITKLFIGNMDYEECEVSWIIQGNYSRLWAAMPQLKELTIMGSTDLDLGQIAHDNLESLEIICGGLPEHVIQSIQNASLPSLKRLMLYIGVDNYGFDGNADTIRELLDKADFPCLEYLGLADSEIQDQVAEVVLESRFMGQLHTLDLSMGTLTDKGGALLLEKLPQWPNLKKLDLHYHYLSEEMEQKLAGLPLEVDVSERNKPDQYRGEIYMSAMMTE